ncbi:phage tail assembly protein [Sphingomonas bacterium]|uniref:phage tail assembly protein n=1 Tax=Sphingomonas bacterium TaxID=1895847 RepID=UPI0015774780|nr:phage tail assembly protein [Sphingomonas bacterium]
MEELSAPVALAALVAAYGRGEILSQEDSDVLAGLQVQIAPIPDELVVHLRRPVRLGEVVYTELRLHEPTAADWTAFAKLSGVEGDVKAVSVIAAVPEAAVRQIGARDLLSAARYIGRFLA